MVVVVECRRKSGARLTELEDLVEQLRVKLAKLEKEKVKLQVEIRDLSVEYEAVSISSTITSYTHTHTHTHTLVSHIPHHSCPVCLEVNREDYQSQN